MPLGEALRKRRKALGLTLQQLATRVSADSGNLSRIERGEQGLSEAMLSRLCSALDCSPAFLYAQAEAAAGSSPQSGPRLTLRQPQEFVRWFPGVTLDQVRAVLEHAARSSAAVV